MRSAILITYDREHAAREAAALCSSAGYRISATVRQKYLKKPKYGVSDETAQDLERMSETLEPDVIVFDEILKPSQNYNLASKLHRTILDREALILEIFESRASSTESQMQVKLAQMRYEMSRAKEKVRLAKMGEQPGFMGIGKFEVDVYYNDIRKRMHALRARLKKAGKQRELHRQSRRRLGFSTVSLAGYTSAGKTRMFNMLTGENQEQARYLFTTLSTTTRRFVVSGEPLLLSDTVGFISKLPAYMIDAFKSTLEELLYTDVVLVVIDAGDGDAVMKKKFQSCMSTLWEIGVDPSRIIFVLNKTDLVNEDELPAKAKMLRIEDKQWAAASAKTGRGMEALRAMIYAAAKGQIPAGQEHGN